MADGSSPLVVWTDAARSKLGLGGAASARPVSKRGLLADLGDLAASWRGYPQDHYSRRAPMEQWRELRARVARADAETMAEARARGETLRGPAELALRCVFAFVFPATTAWGRADAEACLAIARSAMARLPDFADLLFGSLDDPEVVLRLLDARIHGGALEALDDPGVRALELVHGLGPRAVPALARLVEAAEKNRRRKTDLRLVLDAVALVHTPEAAALLAQRLASADVKTIAGRYFRASPELALRALSPVAAGRTKVAEVARTILAGIVAEHAELAGTALPELGAPARKAVAAARDKAEPRHAEAAPDELPSVLVKPPWRSKADRAIEVVEELAVVEVPVNTTAAGSIAIDPREHPRDAWAARLHWVPPTLVFSARIALPVAHAWLHRSEDRAAANAWIFAFPEIAAAGLVPAAVRDASAARLDAGRVLRAIAAADRAAVDRAVARYPAHVRAIVAGVLALDPLHDCPFEPPKLPDFVSVDALPPPVLRAAPRALPRDAVAHLVEMLAFSSIERPYAGVAIVREACTPESLDALAWAIFEAWLAAGAHARTAWSMDALSAIGGDGCARRLAPKIRSWPAERAPARAIAGVDVLARIGSDVALMHLSAIAERTRFAELQKHARAKLADAAAARGLDADELADRTVPDLDLDPDGGRILAYGARSFRVGFDEHLKPYVREIDSGGALGPVQGVLPRVSKADDADLARASQETWKALKDDVHAIASGQIQRLEAAMIARRRWIAETFRSLLVEHPLLVHLVRRLLFAAYEDGGARVLFRVAEDRTYADAADAPLDPPRGARIGVPHAIDLTPEELGAWGSIFSDYEILQPFAQLGREVFTIADAERDATVLLRFNGARVESARLFGLEHRGYRRMGSPWVSGYARALPGGVEAVFAISPGLDLTKTAETPEQTLSPLALRSNSGTPALSSLDPIVFSELVRDLSLLTGAGSA